MTGQDAERDGATAAAAFMSSLDARDASPHTKRAYRTALEQYLDWLEGVPTVHWTCLLYTSDAADERVRV